MRALALACVCWWSRRWTADAFPTEQWVPPFDDADKLRVLCTDNNHFEATRGRDSPLLNNILRHPIVCKRNFEHLKTRKHAGLIWFAHSLGFCEINRYSHSSASYGITFTRDFQFDFLRAAFALVCHKTDDIGRFHLNGFADIFRMIYEKESEHRAAVCNKAVVEYKDLYRRCHVEYSVESSPFGLDYIRNKCTIQRPTYMLKPKAFFTRFARQCQPYAEFFEGYSKAGVGIGQALANDTVFMNIMSGFVKRAVNSYSQLPYLVLKTRLLLQHFPMAAIKMAKKLEQVQKCRASVDNTDNAGFNFDEGATANSSTAAAAPSAINDVEQCPPVDSIIFDNFDADTYQNFQTQGAWAWLGLKIEMGLLCIVTVNTIVLSILLMKTRNRLSTATILFIFNILFSNALFVASFLCMFADFFADLPLIGADEFTYSADVALNVAETLQTQLFAPKEFLKHLAQETLFSLAQNGSLLGLTHLLVLVLVVINRSMSGKAIKLSRRCVILVFAFVWIFLIVTHIIFSALQFSAITNLDHLFSRLTSGPGSLHCGKQEPRSDYVEIGGRCDRVAIFHTFGVYLLRGHTLFTLIFLLASIVVFTLTVFYHWRVANQHDFLAANLREHTPHRRRETLFNTLLLSIGAFFISVSGQSFIEIAVFWVDDRSGIAALATFYQWTRIAAFVDPVLNPILVSVRTPAIRRKFRFYLLVLFHTLVALFCPCRAYLQRRERRRRRKRSRQSVDSQRTEPELFLTSLCTKDFVRASFLKRSRSRNSSRNHSVV